MAKVVRASKEWEQRVGESFSAHMARQQQMLRDAEEAESRIDPKVSVVGVMLSFPVADGCALYRVVKDKPLTMEHIPYMDAYQASACTTRGVRRQDVVAVWLSNQRMRDMRKRDAGFYETVSIGAIVHYKNSHNQYVRCRVIAHNGCKALLALGLVGKWLDIDLPRWTSLGEFVDGTWAAWARSGKHVFSPHPSCIVESANPALAKAIATMTPLNIEITACPESLQEVRKQTETRRRISELLDFEVPYDTMKAEILKLLA